MYIASEYNGAGALTFTGVSSGQGLVWLAEGERGWQRSARGRAVFQPRRISAAQGSGQNRLQESNQGLLALKHWRGDRGHGSGSPVTGGYPPLSVALAIFHRPQWFSGVHLGKFT